MTRQNRGQWFLICQFKEKEKKKKAAKICGRVMLSKTETRRTHLSAQESSECLMNNAQRVRRWDEYFISPSTSIGDCLGLCEGWLLSG